MNWLFIDTSKSGEFRVGVLGKGRPRILHGKGRSNKFLPVLVRSLSSQGAGSLAGICVVAGPGSFTAVRTGVLVANVIARYSMKPLYGISVEQAQDLALLHAELESGRLNPTNYVAPVYDSEPNITMKKDVGISCYA